MKFFILISLVFGLLCSCDLSSEHENDEKIDEVPIEDSDFLYSIAIKSFIGEDLLDWKSEGVFGRYRPEDIKIISPYQNNVKKQNHIVSKFKNEWRIKVIIDFEEEEWDNYVETILELRIIWPYRVEGNYYEGVFTKDTINCGISKENDIIICNDIKVNGILLWERNKENKDPFIELEKEYCRGAVVSF